jgi:hypothetical protein
MKFAAECREYVLLFVILLRRWFCMVKRQYKLMPSLSKTESLNQAYATR